MRKWRVGSISMGISLIALGITLFLSQLYNWEVATFALSWIPVLLIILGIEILVFLLLSNQEQPVVKYDVFSILFILFIGIFSLSIYFMTSSGIVATVKDFVDTEEINGTLPSVNHNLENDIEKVVIEANNNAVKLEANKTNQVSVFGSFRSNVIEKVDQNDFVSIHQVGDTLYVELLAPPSRNRLGYQFIAYDTTISVPGTVDLETRSSLSEVNIELSKLKADWYIENSDTALLSNSENANVTLFAPERNDPSEEIVEKGMQEKTFGNGTYSLTLQSVYQLDEIP